MTQLQHALQTAALAEAEGADDALVTAACCTTWATWCTTWARRPRCAASTTCTSTSPCPSCAGCSPTRVLGAVQGHVDAKRYLCATPAGLSGRRCRPTRSAAWCCRAACSTPQQAAAFIAQPGARRRRARCGCGTTWPRAPTLATPPLAHFLARARRCALLSPASGKRPWRLTWPVVLAVLLGALLHAGWNALVKCSGDKPLDTALVHFMGAIVALPLLLWVGLPRPDGLPYIAASLVIHIGYYIALAGAYQHGDLGLTYPIMRGFAPLLVALGSGSAASARRPAPAPGSASSASPLGVALVGLAHPGEALHHRKALAFAFANAGIIARLHRGRRPRRARRGGRRRRARCAT